MVRLDIRTLQWRHRAALITWCNAAGGSERSGESPEFLGSCSVRPSQGAEYDISRTRIQIALELTPDRFR
jgi:hypothetical protein